MANNQNQSQCRVAQSACDGVHLSFLWDDISKTPSRLVWFAGLAFEAAVVPAHPTVAVKLCVVKTVPTVINYAVLSFNLKSGTETYKMIVDKKTDSCEFYKTGGLKFSCYSGCTACVRVIFTAGKDAFLTHHPSPGQDLWNSALNQQFTDVTFKVGNQEFAAHKAVVCARSPVFARMFATDMLETRTGVVEINDMDPEVFQEFLRFLYTSLVRDNATLNEMREKLLAAAEKYDVSSLKQVCDYSAAYSARITRELLQAILL